MLEPGEFGRGHHLDAQLFGKFTAQRGNRLLVAPNLAAGELPHAVERPGFEPLGYENPAGGVAQNARDDGQTLQPSFPWHCLNFLPEPQGQGSLRPTLRALRTNVSTAAGRGAGAAAGTTPPPAPATADC